jgi:hypothetical protein
MHCRDSVFPGVEGRRPPGQDRPARAGPERAVALLDPSEQRSLGLNVPSPERSGGPVCAAATLLRIKGELQEGGDARGRAHRRCRFAWLGRGLHPAFRVRVVY